MMKNSGTSSVLEKGDGTTLKLAKLDGTSKNTKTNNKKAATGKSNGSVRFSPKRKNFKPTQNNTLKTWLSKDTPQRDLNVNKTLSSSKIIRTSRDCNDRQSNQVISSHKNKKNEEQVKDHSVNKSKKSNKTHKWVKPASALQKEVDNVDDEDTTQENRARKKFKRIITSPLSVTTSIKEKLNVNYQTSTKSSKSSPDNSSRSCSSKEKVTQTHQNTSLVNIRTSPRSKKSSKLTFNTNTSENAAEKNSSVKSNKTKNVTPTKQKRPEVVRTSPRTIKSAKTAPAASVSRKLFDMFSPNEATNISLTKNSGKDKASTSNLNNRDISKSNKSKKKTEPIKSSSKKDIKDFKDANISTSKSNSNTNWTERRDTVVTPTTQNESPQSLRTSPRTIIKSPKCSCDIRVQEKTSNKFSKNNSKGKSITKKHRSTDHSGKSSKQSNGNVSKKAYKRIKNYKKLDVKINPRVSEDSSKKRKSNEKIIMQTLDNFLNSPKDSKRKLARTESNESCEFPSSKKKSKKLKSSKTSDSFEKYGVAVPSVEEILKEQKDLEQYKNQIESFEDIDDKIFELPFSVKDLKKNQVMDENILGCKHLSNHDIEEAFRKNLDYVSDIFHAKQYSERHARFFEANTQNYAFTVKDLCYSTSTIVFSFEQKELMLALLKKEFDPNDKWTLYFFQVLLPELCLKIFMDVHNMTQNEAVKYLDTRPVVD